MTHYTQVTVFGGTGFIGRYVIDQLADLGVTVRVATRSVASGYFLRTAGSVGQVVPFVCDIHDDADVRHAVEGSDWVINLVGLLAEKGKKQTFEKVHHEFPERLAKACARAGVKRFVQLSALGASISGPSNYARTKALGEEAVFRNFPEATILRPSVVFGPEDRFFNMFAQMASILPAVMIVGGDTQFQPVYVGDVAQAVVKSLTASDVQGKVFELAGDERYSFRGLMQKMFDYTGQQKAVVSLPFALAKIQGAVLQHLPGQLLTVDQVRQLRVDNVTTGANPGLSALGIVPETLDAILPQYLKRFYPGGRFAPQKNRA